MINVIEKPKVCVACIWGTDSYEDFVKIFPRCDFSLENDGRLFVRAMDTPSEKYEYWLSKGDAMTLRLEDGLIGTYNDNQFKYKFTMIAANEASKEKTEE